MRQKKLSQIGLTMLALLLGFGVNTAGFAQESYWYAAGSIGRVDVDDSEFKDSDTVSLYAGRRFSDSLAAEFVAVDLGEFDVKGFSDTYLDISGFEISAVGLTTVGERVELFAKGGLFVWDYEAIAFGDKFDEEDGTSFVLGLGAQLPVGDLVGFRFEWVNYYDIEDENLDTFNLGAYFRF